MIWSRSHSVLLTLTVFMALTSSVRAAEQKTAQKNDRPSLSLRLAPRTAIAPVSVTATADLKGGSDNFEDYYCATIEWDWDDGMRSESTADCEPFDLDKSEIRRRYTAQHTYRRSGFYRVTFRLKKKDKALAVAASTVQITGGDPFGR